MVAIGDAPKNPYCKKGKWLTYCGKTTTRCGNWCPDYILPVENEEEEMKDANSIYTSLPGHKRWLKDCGDCVYQIGGRDTDLEQIAASIKFSVRNAFEINKVPEDIVTAVNKLQKTLEQAEDEIQEVIILISERLVEDDGK